MPTNIAPVISLRSHPAWRSRRRRSEELRDAMRRHPSYRGQLDDHRDEGDDAVVLSFAAR